MIPSKWLQSKSFMLLIPVIQVLVIRIDVVPLSELVNHVLLLVLFKLNLNQFKVLCHISLNSFQFLQICLTIFLYNLILQNIQLYLILTVLLLILIIIVSVMLLIILGNLFLNFKKIEWILCLTQDDVHFESHKLLHEHKVREVRQFYHIFWRSRIVQISVVKIGHLLFISLLNALELKVLFSQNILTITKRLNHLVIVFMKLSS